MYEAYTSRTYAYCGQLRSSFKMDFSKRLMMFVVKIVSLCALFVFPNIVSAKSYEYAVIGDAGEWNNDTQNIYHSLLRHDVRTLIMPGDNLYSWPWSPKTYSDIWLRWSLANFDFFAPAIGNHHGGYETEVQFFKMPGEYYSRIDNDYVKFIVLNSDNKKTSVEQAQFLEAELALSHTPFTFIVYHHPTYRVSPFHSSKERQKFQEAIRPILKKYRNKITALIVGHDHVSLVAHFDDLPVILSGSSHEQRPHVPLHYTKYGTKVRTDWFDARYALWTRLKLDDASSQVSVDYIRGKNDKNICSLSIVTGEKAKLKSNCFDRKEKES